MKGIYLAAFKAFLPGYDLDYNDIKKTSKHINIICDMLDVDLSLYDFVLASPPCNYYSRMNYRRDVSSYALSTKHLLPDILDKLGKLSLPFIVENVRSPNIFKSVGIYDICDKYNIFIYDYGRHTYFTNIMIDFHNIPQVYDFYCGGIRRKTVGIVYNQQGGYNVDNVFKYFLEVIHS